MDGEKFTSSLMLAIMFVVFVVFIKSSLTNVSNFFVIRVLFILVSTFKSLFLYFSLYSVAFIDEIISFNALTFVSSVESTSVMNEYICIYLLMFYTSF